MGRVGVESRGFAPRNRLAGGADPVEQALGDDLAPPDADGTGERGWLGKDGAGRRGHIVAARGSLVAHENHDRFQALQVDHLAPDQVGGEGGAPGRIDVQHDGGQALAPAGSAELLDQGVGAGLQRRHGQRQGQRRPAAGTQDDGALQRDDADGPAAVPAQGPDQPAADPMPGDHRSGRLGCAQVGRQFVLVAHSVEQARLVGLPGGQGHRIQQLADPFGAHLPPVRHGAHQFLVEGVEDRLQHLAVGFGHLGALIDVGRGLVLADGLKVGFDPDQVQGILEKEGLCPEPGEPEAGALGGHDLVTARGQVVGPHGQVGHIGHGPLARPAKAHHRLAQAAQGRRSGGQARDDEHDALDPGIGAQAFQRGGEGLDAGRRRRPGQQGQGKATTGLLGALGIAAAHPEHDIIHAAALQEAQAIAQGPPGVADQIERSDGFGHTVSSVGARHSQQPVAMEKLLRWT